MKVFLFLPGNLSMTASATSTFWLSRPLPSPFSPPYQVFLIRFGMPREGYIKEKHRA